jgi:hypothetical protein
MRSVFLVNFAALKEPKIYMSSIREASLTELEKLRKCAESLNYQYGSRVKKYRTHLSLQTMPVGVCNPDRNV